jgi:isocitrate/isopropylmalate dehydrogenase
MKQALCFDLVNILKKKLSNQSFSLSNCSKETKLTLVDKANILETSRLCGEGCHSELSEGTQMLFWFYCDTAAMQIIINQSNLMWFLLKIYLEIFYLMKLVITGTQLLLPSASLGSSALFEPIHGSFQKEKIEILPILLASILQLCFWSILDYMLNH